jgi:hypothetical protein
LGHAEVVDDKRAAEIVTAALLNPSMLYHDIFWPILILLVYVPWDLALYAKHVKKGLPTPASIAKLQKKFPNPMLGFVNEPATLVDTAGRLMLWYLPGIIDPQQVVSVVLPKVFMIELSAYSVVSQKEHGTFNVLVQRKYTLKKMASK